MENLTVSQVINKNNNLSVNIQQSFNQVNSFSDAEKQYMSKIRNTFDTTLKSIVNDYPPLNKVNTPQILEVLTLVSDNIKTKGEFVAEYLTLFTIAVRDVLQWLEKQLMKTTGLLIQENIVGGCSATYQKHTKIVKMKKTTKKTTSTTPKTKTTTKTPKTTKKVEKTTSATTKTRKKTTTPKTKGIKPLNFKTGKFFDQEEIYNVTLHEEFCNQITQCTNHEEFSSVIEKINGELGKTVCFMSRGFNLLSTKLVNSVDRIHTSENKGRMFEVSTLHKKFIVKVNGKKHEKGTQDLVGLVSHEDFDKFVTTLPKNSKLVRVDGKITMSIDKVQRWADGLVLDLGNKKTVKSGFKNFNRFLTVVTFTKK